ncbi:MAG: ATP-grasp domain-containing protein [Tumebacillaceae bacterium]
MNGDIKQFERDLKRLLVQNDRARFVFINNFEVEEHWVTSETGKLPTLSAGAAKSVVNRMEEMGLFLASKTDSLLLKQPIDAEYRQYLEQNGFSFPQIITLEDHDPELNITENTLRCTATLEKLRNLDKENLYLMPFGVSQYEEALSEQVGIPLAVPSDTIFQRVNSKIYSRRLNEQLGIRQIPGCSAETIEELLQGFEQLKRYLSDGYKLVLKDAMGVSGKGLVVIDSEKKFGQCVKMLQKDLARSKVNAIHFVLELWIEKTCDLNHQFIIGRDGSIHFHCVKEALVANGVHQGHLIPSRLTDEQIAELREVQQKIGQSLYADGYYGVVGIDAILDQNGTIWPNLEINARFNMSTYQSVIQERLIDDSKTALIKQYTLKLQKRLPFRTLADTLGDLLFDEQRGTGFLINNFATVNVAHVADGERFNGRLYGVIIVERGENLHDLDARIEDKLSTLQEG